MMAYALQSFSRTNAAKAHFAGYSQRLSDLLASHDWSSAGQLADTLLDCARSGRQVFLAGNGGSAGNAVHLANDFMYAWSKQRGRSIRAHALPANMAVMTCYANDEGYEEVFSGQLAVHARANDVLIVLSGSGNSQNILRALEEARAIGMQTYAVLGYDGGEAKSRCDVAVHFTIDDMQIAEDAQLILGHMIVQHLHAHRDRLGTS